MASRWKNIPVVVVSLATLILLIQRGAKWTVPAALVVGVAGIAGMADHAIPSDTLERSAFNSGHRYGRGEGLGYAAVALFIGSVVNEWRDPEPEPSDSPMYHLQFSVVLTALYSAYFVYQGPQVVRKIGDAIKNRRYAKSSAAH